MPLVYIFSYIITPIRRKAISLKFQLCLKSFPWIFDLLHNIYEEKLQVSLSYKSLFTLSLNIHLLNYIYSKKWYKFKVSTVYKKFIPIFTGYLIYLITSIRIRAISLKFQL